MPPTKSTTATYKETYESVETRIQKAITILEKKGDDNPNITAAAREFNIPMQRLRARWKGRLSKQTRPPTNRKLTEEQEPALCLYLLHCSFSRPALTCECPGSSQARNRGGACHHLGTISDKDTIDTTNIALSGLLLP